MTPRTPEKRVAMRLATAFTLCLPISASSDQVYGRVFVDGQAQPGKSFAVKDSTGKAVGDSVTTDQYGGYSLFLAPGTYIIEFRFDGAVLKATIESYAQPVRQDIYLKKG